MASLRHLSVRVPWHDAKWSGVICNHPRENHACLALKNIRESRDDAKEAAAAGTEIGPDPAAEPFPPCLRESGDFLSPRPRTLTIEHPHSYKGGYFQNLAPTTLLLPPYSTTAVPFRRMLREHSTDIASAEDVDFSDDREPSIGSKEVWVQQYENQRELLDSFFGHLSPTESLVFFYAKETPLSESAGSVLVGVGRITSIAPLTEYSDGKGDRRAFIWDRIIGHTIRPHHEDGFILPYHEILEKCELNPLIDSSRYLASVPAEGYESFQYRSELVTPDAAIAALVACRDSLERARDELGIAGPGEPAIRWINDRLAEIWRQRGPFPGLGAALETLGLQHGTLLQLEIARQRGTDCDSWAAVTDWIEGRETAPTRFKAALKVLAPTWRRLAAEKPKRLALLRLLSRFQLTREQMQAWWPKGQRPAENTSAGPVPVIEDNEILENAYLLYERSIKTDHPISFESIDRGLLPDPAIRLKYPIETATAIADANDDRRIRALLAVVLDIEAACGNTVAAETLLLAKAEKRATSSGGPPISLTSDRLWAMDQDSKLSPSVVRTSANEVVTYKSGRLTRVRDELRALVNERRGAAAIQISGDWRAMLDQSLGESSGDEAEDRARTEKAAALDVLANARICVLVGPAGTGKTTVLQTLCRKLSATEEKPVLLLAPTGKARVRLQAATKLEATTLASFLTKSGRYDWTGVGYQARGPQDRSDSYDTIIVDEASMLDEEQLIALLDSIRNYKRLILVGDPHQLPPIGPGRPFADIVEELRPPSTAWPHVAPNYAELTVSRRSRAGFESAAEVARLFRGEAPAPDDESVLPAIVHKGPTSGITVETWGDEADLEQLLLKVVVGVLGLNGVDDHHGFEVAHGAAVSGNYTYFNIGAAQSADRWQILTPHRARQHGTGRINELIQRSFRRRTISFAQQKWPRIPKPYGADRAVYGDKVICTSNQTKAGRYDCYPDGGLKYVANGEVGIHLGPFKTEANKHFFSDQRIEVEFSTQAGHKYTFRTSGDGEAEAVELAYAITVHKAQGSEFEQTIVVIPKNSPLVSRELLYTALTRSRGHIHLLIQGDLGTLLAYRSEKYSELAKRLTDLFREPTPIEIEETFFEKRHIHTSERGEFMISKSEVIVANMLHHAGIDYGYEQPLANDGAWPKLPDFTFEYPRGSGRVFYWEHLGMLIDPIYKRRWAAKRAWYQARGVAEFPAHQGGSGPFLVTSEDDPRGGIDSKAIAALIQQIKQGHAEGGAR